MEEKLKEIANSIPEVKSLSIVDEEGFILYKFDKPGLDVDPEEISVHIVNPVKTLVESIEDISGEKDSLEEMVLFTEKHVLLVYKLVNDTYLVALAERDHLYGKIRFKLRAKLNEIKLSL
ncbi:hypothetical protein Dester_1176 [Desulfurobacterium thermolithotrophum DSM 11699]|uniref:Roadblock/LC7 family protein n=1 Tax=Desulfurobacterium thermolithotrophum (strain DSM 11699 / BSA) TaxID=868864 RepID=F0S0D3_DESTD|nr:hypothetical protein [Desulfurobacterium thermolithotrophum]ADY73812.1 hypothetical protein Dester_1176 [Desulfurobacterium thermolithotrophum DSM 11699]